MKHTPTHKKSHLILLRTYKCIEEWHRFVGRGFSRTRQHSSKATPVSLTAAQCSYCIWAPFQLILGCKLKLVIDSKIKLQHLQFQESSRATHTYFLPCKHNSSCFFTSVHNPPVFVEQSFDLNLVFTDTYMLTGHSNSSISCTTWSFHTNFVFVCVALF